MLFLEESMWCLNGQELVQPLSEIENLNGSYNAVSFSEEFSVVFLI